MADRSSAALFGEIFNLLVEHVDGDAKGGLALKFWKMSRNYDFSPYQMYCDEALEKLGLARKGVNPRYPDDGEVLLYGPDGDE